MSIDHLVFSLRKPLMFKKGAVPAAAEAYRERGWPTAVAEISESRESSHIAEAIGKKLWLPEYCGSTWDSLLDVADDVQVTWSFPLALILEGVDAVMLTSPSFAAETIYWSMQFGDRIQSSGAKFELEFALA